MKITAPADVYLAAIGDNLSKGDVIDVDDELGAQLLAQGWKQPTASKPRRKANRTSPAAEVADPTIPEE